MNIATFPRSTLARHRDYFVAERIETGLQHETRRERSRTRPEIIAIWSPNPDTGRIECRWTADRDEIARWLSRPWIERAGIILAAAQQARFDKAGRLR
ncbi:hypothetical protein ACHMW4_19965 [Mesorhizobium sp. UC22_110]|uniref:hypothetical protein n=1 Tax=Mesorhizobium TaxID=68287 RepID=UPI001010E443|nr:MULTISPECIES: hypothetical protein [Mesorhizobium]MBR2688916.1 hypothetical protein [Aquamicrobium sp.]QAZ42808.1 hypothetical protein C1M53_07350 [Mesorhizobium sp. Pch-S]